MSLSPPELEDLRRIIIEEIRRVPSLLDYKDLVERVHKKAVLHMSRLDRISEEEFRLRTYEILQNLVALNFVKKAGRMYSRGPKEYRSDSVAHGRLGKSPLTLYIDPGSATAADIGDLLHEISILYQMIGGSGIAFRPTEIRSLVEA